MGSVLQVECKFTAVQIRRSIRVGHDLRFQNSMKLAMIHLKIQLSRHPPIGIDAAPTANPINRRSKAFSSVFLRSPIRQPVR
ncbi:hypothetical protein M404DRAFT_1003616, partial [Pisolithus tinctorius Marx 270]